MRQATANDGDVMGPLHLGELLERVNSAGPAAPLLFIVFFALAAIVFIPASLLTMAAGALFGFGRGVLWAYAGAVVGACFAFLIARYVARSFVERRLAHHPRLAAVGAGVEEHGWKIVALLRLSPVIPYNLINLSMGLTRIRFPDFALSCAAMLPVTTLYVYYGAAAGSLAAALSGHEPRTASWYVSLAVGLVATVLVTTLVTRIARRALAPPAA